MIGAGPKAVALAAKHRVLAYQKFDVPALSIYDPSGVAAHWDGENGYTNGQMSLGTPPEKDIGFPYEGREIDNLQSRREVNSAMLAYSWAAFNVDVEGRSLAEWVDRGRRAPKHHTWAAYLRWVAKRVDLEPRVKRLERIGLTGARWRLSFSGGEQISSDGLVITSPGPGRRQIKRRGIEHRIFDGQSLWGEKGRECLEELAEVESRVCVIGSGETAAASVVHLIDTLGETSIDLVSREGIIFSRGETYEENRLYSDPRDWLQFEREVRQEFVDRTDRGVFSQACKERIDECEFVKTIGGTVAWIKGSASGVIVGLEEKDAPAPLGPYDLVVDATGFDRLWFLDLMDPSALAALRSALPAPEGETLRQRACRAVGGGPARPTAEQIDASIGHNLEVEGLRPYLHLPMFATIERGPGFPSLGCLGTLSDRILTAYSGRLPARPPAGRDGPRDGAEAVAA